MRSDPQLRKWFRIINRKFFGNELPDNVCVRWAHPDEQRAFQCEEKYFGWAKKLTDPYHTHEIVLTRKLNTRLSARLATLAHEMCHICLDCRDDHGPAFERTRQMIADRGIFKKGALAKKLTIF